MLTNTVFILGAGASQPYGLPLAEELVDATARSVATIGTHKTTRAIEDEGGEDPGGVLTHRIEVAAEQIADRIRRSGADTIDAFIADSPPDEVRDIKSGMADVIWRTEAEFVQSGARPENGGDWIRWLYNKRMHREPADFAKNGVVFISFNYDRLPRLLFSTMMANRFSKPISECWVATNKAAHVCSVEFPRFIHPHGALGYKPSWDRQDMVFDCEYSLNRIDAVSEGLGILGEGGNDDESRMYANLWGRAERVYFLGLGYHESLLHRIGLDRGKIANLIKAGVTVRGTGYGLSNLERDEITRRIGGGFQLGGERVDCLAFLKDELRDVE